MQLAAGRYLCSDFFLANVLVRDTTATACCLYFRRARLQTTSKHCRWVAQQNLLYFLDCKLCNFRNKAIIELRRMTYMLLSVVRQVASLLLPLGASPFCSSSFSLCCTWCGPDAGTRHQFICKQTEIRLSAIANMATGKADAPCAMKRLEAKNSVK